MKPTGNITFLFTDIESSTKLAQDYPDTVQDALDIHNGIMQNAIDSNNGFVFEIVGDAFCCAFEKAEDAVKAAVEAQLKLSEEKWKDAVIKIRIGIHSGKAEWDGNKYMGYITLARTARVMSAAYGEQILISNDVFELTREKFDAVKEKNILFKDLGERRLKDLNYPVRLFQVISDGLREDFPPLRTLDARPNNLPVQLTNFIGREEELKEAKELLKDTHLLTFTGSGGLGKTRFALQSGADLIDDFESGVWLVELAAINDPFFLPQSVINTLGLKEEPNVTPENKLINYLKDKEILIILDNCEHLIEACAALTEKLLLSCPKLKIIATSREALKCTGEQIFRIPSLTKPDPNRKETTEELMQYESVRLFIERALAVNSEFRVTNENAPFLAEICSRLDGMPLAIELAAARTKVLSLEKIDERLEDRFNLLKGGVRTSLPRQQTLRALIDWSYDLLSEKEKSLWSKLSVFSGGWTLDAAEVICSDAETGKNEIVDLMFQLSEKSIIIFNDIKERYYMLETLKQYGIEKLKNKNEIYDRFINYFMELSQKAEPEINGKNAKQWLDILEADHENFLSVIECSININKSEKGARAASALGKFWAIRGYFTAGRRLQENLLKNLEGADESVIGKSLNWLAEFAYHQGDYKQSRKYSEESMVLFRNLNNKQGIAIISGRLGSISEHQGDYESARKLFEESLTIFRQLNDNNGVANILNNLGSLNFNLGEYGQARNYYKESLDLKRVIGDKHRISVSLNNLVLVALILGEYEEARKLNEESLELSEEIGDKRGISHSFSNLGEIEFACKNFELSKKYFTNSLNFQLELGLKREVAGSLISLAAIIQKSNNYSLSAKLIGTAEMDIDSIGGVLNKNIKELKEKTIAELYDHLSYEEFKKFRDEGKKMTLEEAYQLIVSS